MIADPKSRAGLDIVTTCSTANFSLVKSLGASVAFDYKDPQCAENIVKHTRGRVRHAFDCISDQDSVMMCSKVLSHDGSSQPARYCSTLPVEFPREDVVSTFILGYTAVGEAFHKFLDFPADFQAYEAARQFWGVCQPMINEGELQNHPIEARDGGLEAISEGLADMKEGRIRAKKLVYRIR
jgi:NADPH:quinone reductase-like Zn-dependent oxidoreductase